MRGVVGKLQWASREGMPQGAGDASMLAATFPTPRIQDLTEANAALRRLIDNDTPWYILSIPLDRLRMITFSDSSHGNAAGGSAQIGHLVCACDNSLLEGKEANVSILLY